MRDKNHPGSSWGFIKRVFTPPLVVVWSGPEFWSHFCLCRSGIYQKRLSFAFWNNNSSLCQIMDIFCFSQPALVGCDDDAQISSEHEEEGEQNVSLSL